MSSQAELIDKRQRKICAAREKIRLVENSLKTVIVTALCGVLFTHDALGDRRWAVDIVFAFAVRV